MIATKFFAKNHSPFLKSFCLNLNHELTTSFIIRFTQEVRIDYRIIDLNRQSKDKSTIVLLNCFGSDWGGISVLGFYLAMLGYKICILSLPGFGNSNDPIWRDRDFEKKFLLEAEILAEFAKNVMGNEKVHWVGHSLGGAILTKFAQEYPNLIRSLVLLNPAGFKKVSTISSLVELTLNDLFYQVAFLEDPVLMQVLELLPKQKSSFARNRLSQRWRESQQVGRNSTIEYFENISEKIPIGCFFSNWDFATQAKYLPSPKKTWWYCLKRSYFNTIMFGSQDAANLIDDFVKKNCCA